MVATLPCPLLLPFTPGIVPGAQEATWGEVVEHELSEEGQRVAKSGR